MGIRATEQEVKDVLAPGGDYKAGMPIEPFLAVGSRMVDWVQANAADYGLDPLQSTDTTGPPLVPSTARLVETWLAAWAYKNSDQQYTSRTQGRAGGSYKGQTGMGLSSNHYGQTAMALDSTGMLRASEEGRIVGVDWLGKVPTDQIPYVERR